MSERFAAYLEGDQDIVRCPHLAYRELSPEGDIVWVPEIGSWVVTRHADILAILRQPARFSSYSSGDIPFEFTPGHADIVAAAADDEEVAAYVRLMEDGRRGTLLNADPPRHGFLRQAFVHPLSPTAVAAMKPHLQAAVDDILAALPDEGEIDFLEAVAVPLPLRVVGDFLGIPLEDRERFREVADGINSDEMTPEAVRQVLRFEMETREYFHDRVRQADPDGGGFLGSLNKRCQAGTLTIEEAGGLCREVVVAGIESTRYALMSVMILLLSRPELLAEVRGDATRLKPLIEETLRLTPPFTIFWRRPFEDTEINGVRIAAGQPVCLAYVAANRDPRVFSQGDEPDLAKARGDLHLAFGQGAHFCPGAALARTELTMMLSAFLERYDFASSSALEDIPYLPTIGMIAPTALTLKIKRR